MARKIINFEPGPPGDAPNPEIARNSQKQPEITAKLVKLGLKIIELPITYRPREFEEGKKIHWKDGFQAIYALFKYRILD